MKKRSEDSQADLKNKIIGLGERSIGKSYYPELRRRLEQLQEKNRQLTREIEERKRSDSKLLESRERLSAIFRASPNPIVVYDADGLVENLNPSFEQIFGWSLEELEGKRIPFVPPEEQEITQTKIKEIFSQGSSVSFNTRRLTKTGDLRDIFVRAALIKSENHAPTGMVVSLTDLTETRQLEFKLQNAQRMESLGTLAGGIAHDFNNLLMGIMGNAAIMLHDRAPDDADYTKLKTIERYVMDGSTLTQQLLGVAKGGKYEVKRADINAIIKKNSSMFGRTKKEIRIHRRYQKDVWAVMVDRGQIEQVLLNLYVNAWQAMPNGGSLHLQTTNVYLDETAVLGFTAKPGRYVQISVRDTGIGMDEETRLRVFDPFFTTKRMGRGTGLGLASAYGIVENHGGFITVNSRMNEGSTFHIFLPASGMPAVQEAENPRPTLAGTGTILLVDDEEMILDVGQAMLAKLGYIVLTAGGGQAALDIYANSRDGIDLVILDMVMPDMGGGDVYRHLKKLNPEVRVLLSSGYSINGSATDILKQGCNGFIQKPFNLQDLSVKIKEVLV